MSDKVTDIAMEKLKEDESFKKALEVFESAQDKSQKLVEKLMDVIMKELPDITDHNASIQDSRVAYMTAKLAAAKALISLASFSYQQDDFIKALDNAHNCVYNELIPMLMDKEPCGQCEECKNGNKSQCLQPKVREEYCESRFLPMLCGSLIEYDAWSEVLFNNIPSDKRDVDVLKDMNEEFQNKQIKKKGKPKSKK